MLVDRVIHRTFMLTAACANPMEAVFAPLVCAIQTDVAVRARSGCDNTAERSEAIGRTVARRIKARRVSRAPAAIPGRWNCHSDVFETERAAPNRFTKSIQKPHAIKGFVWLFDDVDMAPRGHRMRIGRRRTGPQSQSQRPTAAE